MEEFINNPEQIEIMGKQGYVKIQQHRLEDQADLILREYERVINEHA